MPALRISWPEAKKTAWAQGQFIQTLHSEKVEAGVPPSGQRFALEGIFDAQGTALDLKRMHEPHTLALLATSLALQVSLPREAPFSSFSSPARRTHGRL